MSSTMASEEDMASRESLTEELFFMRPSARPSIHRKGFTATTYSSSTSTKSSFSSFSSSSSSSAGTKYQPSLVRTTSTSSSTYSSDDSPASSPGPETGTAEFLSPRSWFQTSVKTSESGHQTAALASREISGSARQSSAMVTERSSSRRDFSPVRGWTEGWMKVLPAYSQDTASAGIGESYLWSGIGGGGLLSALGSWRVWGNKAKDDEIPNGGRATSTSICTASSKTSTTYRGSARHGGTHSWSEGWMKRQHVQNNDVSASTEKQAHSETSSETVVTTERVTVSQTSSSAVITSQTTDVEQEGWSADSATSGDQYGDLSLAKGFTESEDHLQEGEDEVKQMGLTVQTSWNQASSNQNIDTAEQEVSHGRDVHQSVTQHREVAEDVVLTEARGETVSVSVNLNVEQGGEEEQGEQKDEGYKTEEELEETMGVTDETRVTEESTTVTCVANSETTDVSVTIISESLEQDKQVEIMHLEEETGEKLEEDYEGGEMSQVTITEIQEETVADELTDVSQTSVSERLDHDEQAKVMIVEEEKQKTEEEAEEGHDEDEEEQQEVEREVAVVVQEDTAEDGLTDGMVTVISTESTTTIRTETGASQETKVSVISSVGGVSDEQEKDVGSTAEEQHREEITEEMVLEEGDTVQEVEVEVEETGEIITEAAGKRRRRTYSGGLMSYIVPDEEEEEEEMEREASSEEEPMEVSEESRMEKSTGQTETIIAGVQEAASESMEVEISTQSDASSSQTVTSKMTVATLTLQENGQVQQDVSATSSDVEMVGEASQVLTSATEEHEAPGASEATNDVTDITEAGETLDEAAVVGGLEASESSTVETTGTSTKAKVEESTMTSEDVIVHPQEQASIKTTATKRGRPSNEDRRARATTRPKSRSYFLRAKLGPREAKLRAGKALEPATTGQGHKKGEETKTRKRQRVQEDSNSTTAAQQKKQKTVNAAGASVVTDVSLVLSRVDEQKHSDEENTTVSETMEGTLTVSETDPREEQENDEEEKDESGSASTEVQTDLEVASATEKAKETGEGHKDETVTDKNITIVSARVIAETPSKSDYWFRSRRKRRLFDTDDGYTVSQTSTGRKHSLQEEHKKKFAEETGNLSLKKAEQVSSSADADEVDEDNKEEVLAHDKAVVTTTVTESKEQDELQKDTPVNKSNQKKAARVKTTTKKTDGENKDVSGQKRSYWLRGQKAAHGPSMTMAPPAAKTDSMETATETRQSNVGSPLKKKPYFILASTKSSTSRSVTTTATSTVKTVIANTSTGHNAEQEVTSGDIQKQVETSTVVIENQEEYATKGDDEPQLQTELSAEECDTDAGISVESQAVTIIEEAVIDETEDMQTKASVETTDEEVDVQVEVSTVTEENEEGKETEIHPKDEQTPVVEEVLQEEEEILEVEAKEGGKEMEEKEGQEEEEEEEEKEAVGEEEEEDQEPVVEGAVEEAEQDQIETQEETEVEERESEEDDEGIEEMEQTQVKTRRQGRRGNYNLRSRTVYYGSGPSARSGFLAAIATASLSLVHDSGEDTDKVDDGEEMEQEQDERQEEELEDKENEEEDEEETREQEQLEELEEEERERDIVERAEESGKSDEGDAMEQEQDERQEEELKDKENEKEDGEERREQAQVEELSEKEKETDMEERAEESGTPDEGDIMEQEQDEQQKEELEKEEKKAEEEEEIQFAKEQTPEVEEAEVDEQEQDQDIRQEKEESEGEEKEAIEEEGEDDEEDEETGQKRVKTRSQGRRGNYWMRSKTVYYGSGPSARSGFLAAIATTTMSSGAKISKRTTMTSIEETTTHIIEGDLDESDKLDDDVMEQGRDENEEEISEEEVIEENEEEEKEEESPNADIPDKGEEEIEEDLTQEEEQEKEIQLEEKGEESINVDKGEEETEEDDARAQDEEEEKQVPSEEVAAMEQQEEETQKEADGEKEGQLEVEQEQVAAEEEAVVEMEIAEQDERKEEESDEEEAQAVEEEEEEDGEEKNEEGKQVGRSGVGRRGNYSLRSRTVYYGSGPSARGGFLAAIATTAMSRTGKSQTKIYDANSEGKARGHSSLTSKKTTMTSSEEMATATLVDKGDLEEESGVEESRSVEDITVVSEPSEAELQTTTTYFITEITEDGTKGDEMSVDAGTDTTSLTRTTVSTVTTTTETDNTMLQDVTSTAGGKTIIEEHTDSMISSASAVVTHDKEDNSEGEEISDDAGEEQVSEGSFHESMVTDVTSTTETDMAASEETDTAVSHETIQEIEQSPEQKETMETIEESLIAMAVEDDRMEREAAAKKGQAATAEGESDSEAEAETSYKVTESEEGTVTRRRKGGSRGNYSLRSRTVYYGSGPSARGGFRAAMAVTAMQDAGVDRTVKTSKAKAILSGKAKETDVNQASSTSSENSEDSPVVDQEAPVMETSSSEEESSEEIQESSVEDTATVESLVDQTVEQQADGTSGETTEHQDASNAGSEDTLNEQQESEDKDANTSDTEVDTGLDVGQEADQTSEEDSNDQETPQTSKVDDVAQIDAAEVPPVPTKASKKRKLEEASAEEQSTKGERSQKGSRGNYSLRSRTVYYGSGPSARSGFLAAIATATMSSKQGQSVSSRSAKKSSRVVKSGDDTGEIDQTEEDNTVTIQDDESDDLGIALKTEVAIVSEDISTSTKLQEGEEEAETVSTTIVEGITDEDIEGVLEELSESAASGQMSLEDAMAEAASPKDILSENQEESGNETVVEHSTEHTALCDKEAASEPPEEETSTLETDDIAADENDEEEEEETDKEHTIETLDLVSVDDQSSTTVKSFQTSDKQQDELNIVSSSTSKRSRKKRKIDHAETVELSEADSTDVSIVEEQTASTTDEDESEEMVIKTSTRKESVMESRESGGRSYWLRKRTVMNGSPSEVSVSKSSTVYESDSKKSNKGKEANTKATKRAATTSQVVASKKSRKEATVVQTVGEIDSPSIATMSEVQEGSSAYHIQSTTEDVAATTSTMVTSSENSLSQKTDTSVMEEGETSSSTTTLVYEPGTASTSTETTVMTNVEVHSEGTCDDGTPEEVMTTTTKTATSKRGSRKSGPKTLTNDEKMREAISASETEEAMVSTASTSSEDQGTTSESLLSTGSKSISKSRTVRTTTVTTSGRTVSRSHTTIVTKSSSSTTDIVSRGSLGQVYSMSLRKLGDKQRRVYTWNT